jgi:hypothetical protein
MEKEKPKSNKSMNYFADISKYMEIDAKLSD